MHNTSQLPTYSSISFKHSHIHTLRFQLVSRRKSTWKNNTYVIDKTTNWQQIPIPKIRIISAESHSTIETKYNAEDDDKLWEHYLTPAPTTATLFPETASKQKQIIWRYEQFKIIKKKKTEKSTKWAEIEVFLRLSWSATALDAIAICKSSTIQRQIVWPDRWREKQEGDE